MKKYIPYVLFAIIFYLLFDISEVRRNNDIQLYNRVKRIECITKLLPLGEQWLNPSDKNFVLHLSNVGFYFIGCDDLKEYGDEKYIFVLNICNLQSITMKNVKLKVFSVDGYNNEYIINDIPSGKIKQQTIILKKQSDKTLFRVELIASSVMSGK